MSDRLLVATRKGLFTIRRGRGGAWDIADVAFLGTNSSVVLHDPRHGSILLALDHGHFGTKMQRSTDGGSTWAELPAPAYPPRPADATDVDPDRKTPVEWKLKKVWALAAGAASEPDRLWCGTLPGGLFTSTDSGESWQLVRSLWDHPDRMRWFGGGADEPGIHSICVDPRNPARVAVAVSCGGVWLTENSGESWECRSHGMRADYMPPESKFDPVTQDPHIMVQCAASPDTYWVQHHNGVFRSTDNLASWHEIWNVAPSTFGFAVAVHPRDANTAWFVPAVKDETRVPVDGAVVVARTRDGGRTFDVLREGLPQQHAYDLTYRHALDVDSTGDRLAFGSTTGSLWVTENAGDSWQTISTHLPPIHCVRFG